MESTIKQMSNAFEDELPPGFRFHPTDEELVTYYLTNKVFDSTFSTCAVAEADLNKCEPWDLPAKAKIGEKELYFFSLRDRKYPRGLRTSRATETGYWKTTEKDREVFSSRSSTPVGIKRTLVFYKGRASKAEKTNWVMHEYRLQGKLSYHPLLKKCKGEWAVCRIFKKSAVGKRSSIGLIRSHPYLDIPGSPSLPSLLESPRNITAENDQKTRSSERQARTSANAHDESCFSMPMEPRANLLGQNLHQIQSGSSSEYLVSSDQVSEMDRLKEESSYMQSLMVNDQRINMNDIPTTALFSVSNVRGDQISAKLDEQPWIQQLPGLQPYIVCDPHMRLTSNYSNLGFSIHAYFSAPNSSNVVSKVLVSQSAAIPVEPFSSSSLHHKTLSNNSSIGANNCVNSLRCTSDGLSQNILAQPIQEPDGATCLSSYLTDETISVVCNPFDQPLDQLDSSVDLHSVWNITAH